MVEKSVSDNSNPIKMNRNENVEVNNSPIKEKGKKIIQVEMGKQKKLHMLKSDPLKNQEVRHSYY